MRQLALVLVLTSTGGLLGVGAQETIELFEIGEAFEHGSTATAVNGHGMVVGTVAGDTAPSVFTWTPSSGVRVVLQNASARDINKWRQIVGSRGCNDGNCPQNGYVWSASAGLRNLGDFHPWAINESGDMAGRCQSTQRACAMIGGRLYVIALPSSLATDINEHGAVSGFRWNDAEGRSQPFVWSRATGRRALDASPFFHGYAESINDFGQVVGALAQEPSGPDDIPATAAVRWRSIGRFTAVHDDHTWALAVENHGWVVGFGGSTADPNGVYPILWRKGRVTRLPLPDNPIGGFASDINESGWIVGSVFDGGETARAAVWRLRD